MPSVVISILSDHWIILSLTIFSKSMLQKNIYLRCEKRIIQGIDMCPAVCLDNGRYQKCFVCGDNTDEVPFISRPALSNAISQTIYPRSQRLHHIYFPGAIIVTKLDWRQSKPIAAWPKYHSKKINLNWQSCPKMSFELLKNKYTQYLYHFMVWQIRWYFRFEYLYVILQLLPNLL